PGLSTRCAHTGSPDFGRNQPPASKQPSARAVFSARADIRLLRALFLSEHEQGWPWSSSPTKATKPCVCALEIRIWPFGSKNASTHPLTACTACSKSMRSGDRPCVQEASVSCAMIAVPCNLATLRDARPAVGAARYARHGAEQNIVVHPAPCRVLIRNNTAARRARNPNGVAALFCVATR